MCNTSLQPIDSAYGLAKHRDGRWEWAVAPGISPSSRYQHAAVSLLHIAIHQFEGTFSDSSLLPRSSTS
jgi:protein phosphatase